MANYDLTYEGSRVQGILDTGNSLKDAGYIFRGEATPSTVPGTPTERVAYIGGPGTYTNFGSSITVGAGCICVFKYTGSAWSNQVINTGLDSAVNTLQSAITAINNNIGNGYVYAGVATPSTSPVTGKVFYLAVQAGTYTNFGNAVVTAGLNVIKYNGSAWSVDQVIAIDAEPTQGSANLVKSGGVLNSIIQNGPAFDLSAYNAQGGVLATYADLSAALTALNALPADFKKGGMSVKFVQTSDNNYIQARLMANAFTTDITKWQVVDDEPTAGSDNLVKSGGIANSLNAVTSTIQSFQKVYNGYLYNNNNGNWNTNDSYAGVKKFYVEYMHKYSFSLPIRYIIHFDANGNYLRSKSFTNTVTEYTVNYNDVVYIGLDILIESATSPIIKIVDISDTTIQEIQSDISEISTKVIGDTAISITSLTPTMGSWVNNAAINTQLSFRENAGDTYGHIRIDLTQFNRVGQILAHDFSCMVSTLPGLLVEAAFVNDENVVIQLHTKESSSSVGGVANRTYNVPDGAVAVYLNYRSTDNTTAEYKTYTLKVGEINLTDSLKAKINSKLAGKTLYNDGDSVAHGASGETPYANQIAEICGMTLTNAAVSGTTIGYKDSDPNYTQSIPERMIANLTNNDYDYILFEGGFNDISHCQIGEITEGFQPATIDPMTTIGGLEKVCQWLWLNKPTAKKLFVLGQKYNYNAQKPFWEAIISVLEKWGIPYVDIWRETQLIGYNSTNKARWYHDADGLHPNTAAYTNFFNDLIISKLESL